MERAERALAEKGCVKLNLQVRAGNDAARRFYARIGYQLEERISLSKLIRTPDLPSRFSGR